MKLDLEREEFKKLHRYCIANKENELRKKLN